MMDIIIILSITVPWLFYMYYSCTRPIKQHEIDSYKKGLKEYWLNKNYFCPFEESNRKYMIERREEEYEKFRQESKEREKLILFSACNLYLTNKNTQKRSLVDFNAHG